MMENTKGSNVVELSAYAGGRLKEVRQILENSLEGASPLDETMHGFLTLLNSFVRADIAAVFLTEPGVQEIREVRLNAVVGASVKRRKLRRVPGKLARALVAEPRRLHWFGELADPEVPMTALFPVLAKRLRQGAAIPLQMGGRSIGLLVLGYSQRVHLSEEWSPLLATIGSRLARKVDHKRACELLANTRLITAVESAGEAIEITDAEGRLEYVNPAFEKLSGYSSVDILGVPLTAFLRSEPDDLRILEEMNRTLRRGEVWRGRLVGIRKSGRCWHQGATVSPVVGPGGSISHFVAVKRDITDRIEAEIALARSEQSLAATLNSVGDALIVTDELGLVVRMNPLAAEYTGWEAEEACGQPLEHVVHMLSRVTREVLTKSLIEDALDESVTAIQNRDTVLVARDGVERLVITSSAPILMASQEMTGVVLVFHDMTAEHAVAAALEESQRDFRALIEHNPDGISISRDGVWLYVNPAFLSSLGYESDFELRGQRVDDYLHADEADRLGTSPKLVRARCEGEQSPSLRTMRFKRKNGSVALLEISPERVLRFDGELAVVHVTRDITERKEMESQLMLADRMVSVGTLAAGVAHEINNPLAYVIANLRFVQDELGRLREFVPGEALAEIEAALKETGEGAERVRLIVKDLKSFTRGDEERRELVDVRDVLESSINLARNEIRHRAQLVRQFSGVPLVDGNKARMGQLFLNILINSAQALSEGHIDHDVIRVSTALEDNARVRVSIHDTGPGIPPEVRERIFDPFFTTKPVGVGTGLGLSISHGIATSMGGQIFVDSGPGQGTTFHISFPVPTEGRVHELRAVSGESSFSIQ